MYHFVYYIVIIIFMNKNILYDSIDGQKIAKKHSQQILKETNAIKLLLQEYNYIYHTCFNQSCVELTLSDALYPLVTPRGMSSGKKREVMDSYLLMCRSSEEITLLKKEMHNIVCYILWRHISVPARMRREGYSSHLVCVRVCGCIYVYVYVCTHTLYILAVRAIKSVTKDTVASINVRFAAIL